MSIHGIHSFKPKDPVTVSWMGEPQAGTVRAANEGSIEVDFGDGRFVGFWWTSKRWESTGGWPATIDPR